MDSLSLSLMKSIVHPSMRNFVKYELIETLLPTMATKKIEFELFLLNTGKVIITLENQYPEILEKEGIVADFTNASLAFYKNEKLYLLHDDFFDEKIVSKIIFKRWSEYAIALSRLAETNNHSELTEMIFKGQYEYRELGFELFKKGLELCLLLAMTLIYEELPILLKGYK